MRFEVRYDANNKNYPFVIWDIEAKEEYDRQACRDTAHKLVAQLNWVNTPIAPVYNINDYRR